mgnify:CR=1 FL=1
MTSAEESTASNADAGTERKESMNADVHRVSAVPWKNQGLPLSARTSP